MGNKSIGILMAGALLILGTGPQCVGQSFAGGSFTLNFEGGGLSVWDISGTYDESLGGIDTTFTINVDPQGKIGGSGVVDAYMMGVSLDGDIVLGGTISKAGEITRVNLILKMTGYARYQGDSYKFVASEKVNASIDPVARELTGTASAKVSVAGRSASEKGEFQLPLDGDIDGSWTVPMNLAVDAKGKITGNAGIDISGGKSFDTAVSGAYSTKSGLASLTLKSLQQTSKGLSLKLTAHPQGQSMAVKTVSGKVLGQKVTKK